MIAGSSSGIGYELASLYLSKNYHVIGITRNSPSNFANHQKYIHLKIDLKNTSNIILLSDFLKSKAYKNIDPISTSILLSGINTVKPIIDYEDIDIQDMFSINLLSQIKITKELIRNHNFDRRIDFIYASSIWASSSAKYRSIYGATKSGINGFVRNLSKEFISKSLFANYLELGWVDTPLSRKTANDPEIKELQKRLPKENLFIPINDIYLTIQLIKSTCSYRGSSFKIDKGYSIL